VLGQFLLLKMNKDLFIEWIKDLVGANTKQVNIKKIVVERLKCELAGFYLLSRPFCMYVPYRSSVHKIIRILYLPAYCTLVLFDEAYEI
jgi:hypothetical protein